MGRPETNEKYVYNARFPLGLFIWIRQEVKGSDSSINDFIVRLATDAMTWFGLPRVMIDRLEADREALGLGRREYLMHLLARRYEALLTEGPGFDATSSAKAKRSK